VNKKKSLISSLIIITAVSFFASVQFGTAKEAGKSQLGGGGLYKATGSPRATLVNINQMSVWTRADGFSARNPFTGNSGVVFPRGTAGVIFQDGILWGGRVKDGQSPELRAGGNTYNVGTVEGAIVSKGVQENPNDADVRIWRIREDWETADLRQDAAELFDIELSAVSDGQVATVRAQYGTDWDEWPWEKGAPFYNDDGLLDPNGKPDNAGVLSTYNPLTDRPGIADADQVVWFVRNDLSVGATTAFLGSPPVGFEIQESLWGYSRADALGHMIFKKVVIIYKGTTDTPTNATIEELFLTQWSDPDLGSFGDDFAGSIPELSLGYVYNSSSIDNAFRDFGLPPPAAGYDFFQGPIVDAPGETAIFNLKVVQDKKNLPMSSFVFFAAGSAITDPPLGTYEGTLQWFNLMHGLQPATGNSYIDPITNEPTVFTLSGDPKTGEGWVDGITLGPGDRRFLLTAGPFTMAFQDTQELVISLIVALGADRISSVDVLKFYDITAQNAFDNLFDLPTPPAAPAVTPIAFDKQVVLAWGNEGNNVSETEGQDEKGYLFEGYNVYQLPTQTSTLAEATKLATFDVVNEITTILDPTFEPISGQVLNLPSQLGRNSGIERSIIINTDTDGNDLINYREYYFAVTAYNNNPSTDVPIHSLESSPLVLAVIPQPAEDGTRYTFSAGQLLTSDGPDSSVIHVGAADNVSASVEIVDPSATITADWTITMNTDGAGSFWYNLENEGGVVLEKQTNLTDDEDRIMRNGLTIKVLGSFGAPPTFFNDEFTTDADPSDGDLVLWGDSQLFGAPTGNWFEFGSGTPVPTAAQALPDLQFRFTGAAPDNDSPVTAGGSFSTQWERGSFGEPDLTGFNRVQLRIPFELWDLEGNDGAGRQIEVAVINRNADGDSPYENDVGTAATARWRMTGRDYIIVLNKDYTADAALERSTTDPTATWMLFFEQGGASVWSTGDEYTLSYANPLLPGLDLFTFSTTAPATSAAALDEDFAAINVFPNPYLGVNSLETNRVSRWVRFTHLPIKATIKIFNLAGVHVATVNKSDNLQFADWNLQNWNDLPVASGIYLAHVLLPGGFEKTLKLMVVQEKQFLQNF